MNGVGEGSFRGRPDSDYERRRYERAHERIGKIIGYGLERVVEKGNLVSGEKEAREVIQKIQVTFPDVEQMYSLSHAAHGLIFFTKAAIFKGFSQEREEEIAKVVMDAGVNPKVDDWDFRLGCFLEDRKMGMPDFSVPGVFAKYIILSRLTFYEVK